jgi:hypothetical protein
LFKTGRLSLVVGVAIPSFCPLLGWLFAQHPEAGPLSQILSVSFLILGWVAIWKPSEIFLYSRPPFCGPLFQRLPKRPLSSMASLESSRSRLPCAVYELGRRIVMKPGSLALTLLLCASAFDHATKPALAAELCVELTAGEFNYRAERRGDDNACAGSANIKAVARNRARVNAINAIASQCLGNVTASVGQQACARVSLVADTSANASWLDGPPASNPSADKVKYLGRGTGSAAGVNLCATAHDSRIVTRNAVDGHCSHNRGLMPHRTFAIARAWARCAVACRTP